MALTDGYITNDDGGDWQFANTGGAGRGDSIDPNGDAWARFERVSGGVTGTKCDENGVVSEGPKITFSTPDGLLSGAAEADGKRPWVVWAGVSPMSLREILVVFNKPVVLLNKSKISGGDVVALTGRLLVIAMEDPISINGKQRVTVSIGAGALGFYTEPDETEETPTTSGTTTSFCPEPAPKTASEPGGELPELEDYDLPCDCTEVKEGDSGGGDDTSGGAAELNDALVFADICNAGAQCGEFQGDQASFAVNNTLVFPVRCTHPFVLLKLKICGCATCTKEAKVWMACMEVFGSTVPLELLPIDKLFDIDPCNVLSKYANGFPARLSGAAACCGSADVVIAASAGPDVSPSDVGLWEGNVPGFDNQVCLYLPPCQEDCQENPCKAVVRPDFEDYYVAEDIIKPSQRELPVSFFDTWLVTMTTITIPSTITSTTLTMLTSFDTTTFDFLPTSAQYATWTFPTSIRTAEWSLPFWSQQTITDMMQFIASDVWTGSNFAGLTSLLYDSGVTLQTIGTEAKYVITAVNGSNIDVVSVPAGAKWLLGYGVVAITYCDEGGNEQVVNVVTSISTADAGVTAVGVVTEAIGTNVIVITSLGQTTRNFVTDAGTSEINYLKVLFGQPITNYDIAKVDITAMQATSEVVINLPTEILTTVSKFVTSVVGVSNITLVTSCASEEVEVTLNSDTITAEVLKVATDAGAITLLTEATDPKCDVKYKFLNHPGEDKIVKATGRISIPRDCCEGIDEFCITYQADVEWEENCKNVKLLSAMYVDRGVAAPSAEKCPCFDCEPELPQVSGENATPSDVETLGLDNDMPCTIRVQRVNRRWCITCRGNI